MTAYKMRGNHSLVNRKTQRVVRRKKINKKRNRTKMYIMFALFLLISLIPLSKRFLNYVYSLDYFTIKSIEITGNSRLSAEEIKRLSGVHMGQNIFRLNLDSITDAVGIQPWLKAIEVKRRFPNSVMIKVEESSPVVIWTDGENYYNMDEFGILLEKFKEPPPDSGLTILSGEKDCVLRIGRRCPDPRWNNGLKAIGFVMRNFPELMENVDRFQITSHPFLTVLLKDNRRLLLDVNDMDIKLQLLHRIIKQFPKNWEFREYCDLRFKDKIIFS